MKFAALAAIIYTLGVFRGSLGRPHETWGSLFVEVMLSGSIFMGGMLLVSFL